MVAKLNHSDISTNLLYKMKQRDNFMKNKRYKKWINCPIFVGKNVIILFILGLFLFAKDIHAQKVDEHKVHLQIVTEKTKSHSKADIIVVKSSNIKNIGQHLQALTAKKRHLFIQKDKQLEEIKRQLAADSVPIPPRLGAIFVPLLIKKNADITAPSFLIFDQQGRQVATAKTGKKAFVYPGIYTVKVGSRTRTNLSKYKVRVYKGKLTIIKPRWAALIITVVDERLVQFRGRYDIIDLKTRRGMGTGIGADDSLGEKVEPWLLPPSVYLIVRVGDSYLARTNVFTVQINQGKVSHFRLVMNRNSGNFLGGRLVLQRRKKKRQNPWTISFQLNGSVIWNQQANVPAAKDGHNLSLTAFFYGRIAYNTTRHFFLTTLNAELGFSSSNLNFRKGTDRIDLRSIYIYRLMSFFGPYVRMGLETAIFPDLFYFSEDGSALTFPLNLYDCKRTNPFDPNTRSCDSPREIKNAGEKPLPLSGFFDPLLLKEGIGFNLQAIRTSWLDLRLLMGVGFRQESARDVYQFQTQTQRCKDPKKRNPKDPLDITGCPNNVDREDFSSIARTKKDSSHREGIEVAVVATGMISRFFSFTSEFDALGQFTDFFNFDVDWRTSLILRLSHYASIIYRLRVRRDPAIVTTDPFKKWYLDQSLVLSFSLLY